MSDDDLSNHIKEVYARFGVAFYYAQVLEHGLVNALADATWAVGDRLRQVQTGNLNNYLYVIAGAVAGAAFVPRLSLQNIFFLLAASFLLVVLGGIGLLVFGRRRRSAYSAGGASRPSLKG